MRLTIKNICIIFLILLAGAVPYYFLFFDFLMPHMSLAASAAVAFIIPLYNMVSGLTFLLCRLAYVLFLKYTFLHAFCYFF